MRLIEVYRKWAIEEHMKDLERYKEAVKTLGMPMYFVRKKEETIEYLRTEFSENDFYSGKSYLNEEVIGTPQHKKDGLYVETEKGMYRIYVYQPLGLHPSDIRPPRLICKRIKKK